MDVINFIHIPKNGGTTIEELCNINSLLIYNGHKTDVYNNNISNQIIIIRNPIDRFISAVYYALQVWSFTPNIKYLIDNEINTPEKWIQIMMNENHQQYPYLMKEMKNVDHKIGDKLLEYKWTYSPQNLWINNPKFIILMDNFNDELQYFLQKHNLEGEIKHINSTKHIDKNLSNESIDFLKKFYKDDFILYEKYKNMSIDERL
jgi:hypothetical protein